MKIVKSQKEGMLLDGIGRETKTSERWEKQRIKKRKEGREGMGREGEIIRTKNIE